MLTSIRHSTCSWDHRVRRSNRNDARHCRYGQCYLYLHCRYGRCYLYLHCDDFLLHSIVIEKSALARESRNAIAPVFRHCLWDVPRR